MGPKRTIKYLIVLAIFATSINALGCSCIKSTPLELISRSPIIYAGKVIKSESNHGTIKTTFEVLKNFKGDTLKHEFVFSNDSSASCGINFSVGNAYVVLTDDEKRVSLCRGYDLYPFNGHAAESTGLLKALLTIEK